MLRGGLERNPRCARPRSRKERRRRLRRGSPPEAWSLARGGYLEPDSSHMAASVQVFRRISCSPVFRVKCPFAAPGFARNSSPTSRECPRRGVRRLIAMLATLGARPFVSFAQDRDAGGATVEVGVRADTFIKGRIRPSLARVPLMRHQSNEAFDERERRAARASGQVCATVMPQHGRPLSVQTRGLSEKKPLAAREGGQRGEAGLATRFSQWSQCPGIANQGWTRDPAFHADPPGVPCADTLRIMEA